MPSNARPVKPVAQASPAGTNTVAEVLAQAITLLRDERLDEAEPALQAILQHWPAHPDALHFLGVLRHAEGRTDEAVALIHQSLDQAPDNPGAWNNLGNVLLAADRIDDAVVAYGRCVAAAQGQPESADALNNMGTLLRKQGRYADAEDACRRAIALRADFGDAWYNLSLALMAQGRVHDGLIANSRAVALWPQQLQARDQVIRALLMLGERERAATLYRDWLTEEPDNPVVQHQLAACLGDQVPARAADAYVQQVFDAFAQSFDAKLEKLHYKAPELVAQALAAVAGPARGRLDIVDAGCGTGLCGPLLKPFARLLAGCDLSEGMLRRAHARHLYDTLHQAELVYYLDTQPSRFDAVVSADTLCYFGGLEGALAAAHRCLRPGGWLVFTVEALPDGAQVDHQLQPNGRYVHSEAYLHEAVVAADLKLQALQPVTLRLEAGEPVPGWLVTAGKP